MQAQDNRNMKSAFDFSCWMFGRWNKMLAGSIGYGCFYCSSPLDENVHWCIDHWSIDHCSNEKIHYECWPANCFYIQISHNFFSFVLFCAGCCLPSLVLYRQTDTVSHLGLDEHVNSASHILSIRTKFHCVHVNYEEFLFLCSL